MEKFNFEGIKKDVKKVVVGAGVIAASFLPKGEGNAAGLFGGKDKNPNKIEQTSSKEEKTQEKSDFKEKTFAGIKYPFEKEYKTDDSCYRVVTYGQSMDQMISIKIAMTNAKMEILKQTNSNEANISDLKVLDQKTFLKDGKYITIIAVEVAKDNVKTM